MKAYIDNGGRENYHNLLSYVRKYIDKKIIYASEPGKVVERVYGLLYHADPNRPDDEDKQFNSLAEYNKFLKRKRTLESQCTRYHHNRKYGRA